MRIENYEAEVAVLGSVLLDGTLFKDLEVQEEHFYDSRHKQIYRAMKLASDKGEFIDVVTVVTRLGDALEQAGNTTYLVSIAESVPSTATIKHYEQLIFEAYRMRKSREQMLPYIERPTEEGLATLMKELEAIQQVGVQKQEKTVYNHLVEIADEMFHPSFESGCMTGYTNLDETTGGLQRGDLLILAARPSVGKTAFALNLAANHCKLGGSSMIYSLEMGTKQLMHRMISNEGRINGQKWRSQTFLNEDYEAASRAFGEISNWNLYVSDQKRTILEIRTDIRKQVHDNPEGNHLIIIDYLQLITPVKQRDRRDLEIGEITREMKLLAVELNIPIILISQLSRGVESRPNKRPFLSDLRESGNIEQDADVILFLYREDYYERDTEKQKQVELIISKHRNGPTGTVEFVFEREYGLFLEMKKEGVRH